MKRGARFATFAISIIDNFCLLQHYKNTIGVIYIQRAIGITFYDHSLRFQKSAEKKLSVVERFRQDSMHGLSAGTKKSGRCRELAVEERWPFVEVRL